MTDATTRRIEWLSLRARIAKNNGDHLLEAELKQTAKELKRLIVGIQGAISNPETWKEHLQHAIDTQEKKATR